VNVFRCAKSGENMLQCDGDVFSGLRGHYQHRVQAVIAAREKIYRGKMASGGGGVRDEEASEQVRAFQEVAFKWRNQH
jgi:hypothetical protein